MIHTMLSNSRQKAAVRAVLILILTGIVFAVAGGLSAYLAGTSLGGMFLAYTLAGKLGVLVGALIVSLSPRDWH